MSTTSRTPSAEYRHIWLAAAGGGLLTVGTAAIKTADLGLARAGLRARALLYGLNYAVSFLLMQRFGLILATKQPAMTAAPLAAIVRDPGGEDRRGLHHRDVRSDLALAVRGGDRQPAGRLAGAGRVGALWPLALRLAVLARDGGGATLRSPEPVDSLTVVYADLTGVILWLASVAGGWFDNCCAYHRMPLAIAQHPAGRSRAARAARWARRGPRNGSGWGTNVSLGFMLGMTPALGHFLGPPLDVRHVTLNTALLALRRPLARTAGVVQLGWSCEACPGSR